MQTFLFALLKTSAVAAAIVAIVYLITPSAEKRYSNRWRYYLWIILCVMLVLPIDMAIDNAPMVIPIQQNEIPVAQPQTAPAPIDTVLEDMLEAAPVSSVSESVLTDSSQQEQSYIYTPGIDYISIAFYLWLVGAACYLIYSVLGYLLTRRRIRRWSHEPGQDILSVYECIKDSMGIKRNVPLLISGKADSPMLIGLIHPAIYLPDMDLTGEQLRHILIHELTHLKRCDIYLKALLLIARTMHWFNPFVHLMAKMASQDMEICCDAAATRNQEIDYKDSYARTLLQVIKAAKGRDIILSTSFSGRKKTLKMRIQNLIEPMKSKKGIAILSLLLIIVLVAQGLVACENDTGVNKMKKNIIYPMELTQDQQEILQMIGNNNEIDIYHYYLDDGFNTLLITKELYKQGKLISDTSFTSGVGDGNGMISILFDDETGNLSISNSTGGSVSTSTSVLEQEVLDSGLSWGKTWLQHETEIADGEEFVLMVYVFDDSNSLSVFSPEYYNEDPEHLSQYDYVFIVKGKFTSQSGDELMQGDKGGNDDSEWIPVTDEDIRTFIDEAGKSKEPDAIEKIYGGIMAIVEWNYDSGFEYYELYKNKDGEVQSRRVSSMGRVNDENPFVLNGGTASGDYPFTIIQCMDNDIISSYDRIVVTGENGGEYEYSQPGKNTFFIEIRDIGGVQSIAAYDDEQQIINYDFASDMVIPEDTEDLSGQIYRSALNN